MSWDDAFRESTAELAGRPAASGPATLGQVWEAEWKASGLQTVFGGGKPLSDAYGDFSKQFETTTGKTPEVYARENGIPYIHPQDAGRLSDMVSRLTTRLPEDQRKQLEPVADLQKTSREKAAAIEKESSDIADRTYGISGLGVSFAAGVARQTVDPINLATLPVGGPLKGPVLAMLAREFAINAGVQALQEPTVQAQRGELGLEAGFGQGMTNVIQAGVGAAGLAGLLRGGSAVLGRLKTPGLGVPELMRPEWLSPPSLDFGPRNVDFGTNLDFGQPVARPVAPRPAGGEGAGRPVLDAGPLVREAPGAPARPAEAPAQPAADRSAELREMQQASAARMAEVDEAMGRAGIPPEAHAIEPEDLRAVADLAERNQVFDQPVGNMPQAVHVEHLDRAGTALEKGESLPETADEKKIAELAAAHGRRRQRAPQKTPMTLTQFLSASGGLKPHPELDKIYGAGKKRFVPRYGNLIRETGLDPDVARELATEAGFLRGKMGETTPDDVWKALTEEAAGRKVYSEKLNPETAAVTGFEQKLDDETAQYFASVDKQAKAIARSAQKAGHPEIDPETLDMAARSMVDGEEKSWDNALDRAYTRASLRDERVAETTRENFQIPPGWDDAAEARGIPGGGREVPGTGEPGTRPGQEAAALGEGANRVDAGQPSRATEPTAAGEQELIPGVAPITVRERLEAAAGAPLKGGEAPAGGLFNTEAQRQIDLLDTLNASREADIRARLAEDPELKVRDAAGAEVRVADMLETIQRDKQAADELAKCIGGEAASTEAPF